MSFLKKYLSILFLLGFISTAFAQSSTEVQSNSALTVNSQVTATTGAPATGLSVYVLSLAVTACNDATGAAVTPVNFTTTNLPNTPAIPWANAATVSTCFPAITLSFPYPGLKATSPATAVTLVSPAAALHTAYIGYINYYVAP